MLSIGFSFMFQEHLNVSKQTTLNVFFILKHGEGYSCLYMLCSRGI